MRLLRLAVLSTSLLACFAACPGPAVPVDAGMELDAGDVVADAGAPDAGQPDAGPPVCAAATITSSCGDGALVRGVAYFDPSRVPDGGAPVLRLALRHVFVVVPGEEHIGGRLHANLNVPVTDVASGAVPFTLDMCMFGTAMWSEENGTFHLVGILDLNANNNIDDALTMEQATAMGRPDFYEPAGMVDVDVSCHQPSPCVALRLDCIDGALCTTVTPVASCTRKTPACPSDDLFCQ